MEDQKKDKKLNRIAAIRVRGIINLSTHVSYTLDLLRLYRKNYCVVLDDTPIVRGMLEKVKDYITWGPISEETYKLLIEKKAEPYKGRETDTKKKISYNKYLTVDGKKIKPFFRLSPPLKGFGRKGIKVPYSKGGALGNRKEKINDLIQRMV